MPAGWVNSSEPKSTAVGLTTRHDDAIRIVAVTVASACCPTIVGGDSPVQTAATTNPTTNAATRTARLRGQEVEGRRIRIGDSIAS
jgi:hypothetical protein